MSWRLHLTNRAVQALDILDGQPPLLAAWSRRDRVAYYDLDTGTQIAETVLRTLPKEKRQGEDWQLYLSELVAPNGAFLPHVRTTGLTIYTTDDGRMHLYYAGDTNLFLYAEGKEIALDVAEAEEFRALALDRFLGLNAALAEDGKLHLYQQHIRVGAFDVDLHLQQDVMPGLAISRGGGSIFVTDGSRIVLTDSSGKPRKTLDTHYFIGKMVCSPSGRHLVTSDLESGVLRVYSGSDLTLLRQRFAVDLLARAEQVQLMADPPPSSVALSALAVDNRGVVAFALGGVICASSITEMDELPRPQKLL
ncbi:MAG: hypothetical protein SF029_12695 [bacterium]|nr:hypothetical protein [bacterium]